MGAHILIVDDEESLCEGLAAGLQSLEVRASWRTTGAAALRALQSSDFDAAVVDLRLADMSGLELCGRMREDRPELPLILISAFADLDAAIQALRLGAADFLRKPFELEHLAQAILQVVQQSRLRRELTRLESDDAVVDRSGESAMLGNSPEMRKVRDLVERVAPSDATVLIVGESGTGKELIARALHERSARARGAFVAVNCAAMPAALLESELFGHVRGAFTDARQARKGLFLEASGGTLLLDEIAEMPAEMQAKLLRALQERTVRPVGGNTEVPFDVRLIAATNRDLESEVRRGQFREDLFYRIHVVRIATPPLRNRGNDILLLAQAFLVRAAGRDHKDVAGLSTPAAQKLLAYDWPGNVRELQNCMEQAVALTRYREVGVDDLPEAVARHRSEHLPARAESPVELLPMEEVELRYILQVLQVMGGNKTAAARVLGFDRRTLYRKLEKLDRPGAPATLAERRAS